MPAASPAPHCMSTEPRDRQSSREEGRRNVEEGSTQMKITRISSLVVNANMRNWIFVKVETDQDGLYGWGEATLEWKTAGVVGSVEDNGRLLIGEDPRRIEHLYQMMHRQYFWRPGIEGMTAISG